MNFFQGTLNGGAQPSFTVEDGTVITAATYQFSTPPAGASKAVLGVRPEHIVLGDAAKAMPFQTEVEVEIVEPMGSDTLAWTKIAGHQVTFRCDSDVPIHVGQKLTVGFDPARGSFFDAGTTDRL
jgi:multiple sugar transport system ATP-binding protein